MFVTLKQAFQGQPAGTTVDVAEADGRQLVTQGVAEAVDGDPLAPLVNRFTQALDTAVNGALTRLADVQTQARRHSAPAIFGPVGQGDPHRHFGDFCLSVARGDRRRLEDVYGAALVDERGGRVKAALAEASGVAGGYTVPTEFHTQLLGIVAENTFFRPRAFVQPMAAAALQFPYLDVTTVQSAGVSPFFGGVQMAWTEEGQTRTETEPQFKMMELKAHELSGYSVSSNVLVADAGMGLEQFLLTLFGRAIAWFEEYAFLRGNGVGKPLGVLNAPAAIAVNRETSSEVSFADVAGLYAKLLPLSHTRAVWAYSPSVIPQLLQLKDGADRAIFISIDQGATKRPTWALLGLPAFCTEKLPALGTKGDLMLIDPGLYVIGDRQQIEIAASEHVNFLKNQVTWRVVERVDGQPWLDKAVTLQDGSTQVSPFVVLN